MKKNNSPNRNCCDQKKIVKKISETKSMSSHVSHQANVFIELNSHAENHVKHTFKLI